MPSFVSRVGAALATPRAALAAAGDRRAAGRSGSDLLRAFGLLLVAAQLRAIVEAIWLAAAVDVGTGLRALVHVLAMFTVPLAVLVVGAAAIWAAAGVRRDVGRAFDLACVAAVPIVCVIAIDVIAVRELGLPVPELLASAIAYAWAGVIVALGIAEARRVAPMTPASPRVARAAGLAFVALALIGAVAQSVWIARNLELVRPMRSGAPAPELALPAIGPGGALGDRVTLAATRGKITIVDFWATWCKPCLRALPRLDAFARRHPDIAVIAVAMDDPQGARELFDERHYGALALALDDGDTSQRFGVATIPHTVLIDRAGSVSEVARGGELDLEAAIARIR
ncbi:MAG TPA: TlpA disulfide reductase family protein [Kofleriaceae bacterium]|jgi:thiol-disulfide isomerase/thioredoxin